MSSTNCEQVSDSTDSIMDPQKSSVVNISSPLLSEDSPPRDDHELTTRLLMIFPLALHFLGSVAVAIVIHHLDGRQFYLEREPRVQLVDGTYQSLQFGRYSLLQPEVITILSVSLMILRWAATAWSVSLCWRAIFLLAGKHGLQYRDINWLTNYGLLYPSNHFLRPLNILLGLILIFTLAPQPSAPLLTGSISWIPSNKTVDPPNHPTLTIAGFPPNFTKVNATGIVYSTSSANIATTVVKVFNTAWSQSTEDLAFKRVVPSTAHLSVGSTVDSMLLPYFAVTQIEWVSGFDNSSVQRYVRMLDALPDLPARMGLSGAVALIVDGSKLQRPQEPLPPTWSILINVSNDTLSIDEIAGNCNSSTTILPPNSTVPSFYLDIPVVFNSGASFYVPTQGCFAHATVSFNASHGLCRDCRISSYSTVQNDTELEMMPYYWPINYAARDMYRYVSLMGPMQDSLPDPSANIEVYISTLLTRLYSALWNSWIDVTWDQFRATTGYKPSVPMLRADINQARVYAWLGLQLLLTFGGIGFIFVQLRSRYPLIGDTDMVAFNIDTTEVPKPSPSNKDGTNELLRIEPKEDGWKFVVASEMAAGTECQKSNDAKLGL